MSSAFWGSRAIYLVTKIGIAEIISEGSVSAEELSIKLNHNSHYLDRLMWYLVSMDVYEIEEDYKYKNNRLSNSLRANRPGNIKAMVMLHGASDMIAPWLENLEIGLSKGNVSD